MAASRAGRRSPLRRAGEAQIFGTSNGIPPTAGVAPDQQRCRRAAPKEDSRLDAQSEPRRRAVPALARDRPRRGDGQPLERQRTSQARRIAEGVEDILATGNLRRVPAIFVTGRNDGILPPNFTSRAYFGLNNVVEGSRSPLRYYEVTNAHHLDSFNQFPGYNAMFIPLHRYFIQAMDLMYDHLRHGRPLPPSQVVHTTPRGGRRAADHGRQRAADRGRSAGERTRSRSWAGR